MDAHRRRLAAEVKFRAPMVGGPWHGRVEEFNGNVWHYSVPVISPVEQWVRFFPAVDTPLTRIVDYTRRRWIGILPGRTDRQAFFTMDALDGLTDSEAMAAGQAALLEAWAEGWCPPDEASEFWPHGPDATDAERAFYALYQMGAA